MTDVAVLRSLRERVLDEGESVAGLLRTCVMLGASTGSDELRSWASAELRGYDDDQDLPAYRKLGLPLFADFVSGNYWSKGQQISAFSVPKAARRAFPDAVEFRQSVEELAALSNSEQSSIAITLPPFADVAAYWSSELPMFQDVQRIYYQVGRSALSGMVGVVRTTLVELVADMTADLPPDELPSRRRVDAAVNVNVYGGSQDRYSVEVGTNSGVIGQGVGSSQNQVNGVVPAELVKLIAQLRTAAEEVADPGDRADVEQAINDFEAAASEPETDPETVNGRFRMLRRLGSSVGGALLSAVTSEGAQLALSAAGITG